MNDKRILLASPRMMGNEEKYVSEAFASNWIAPLGPFVNKLEDDFSNYMNNQYALATASGTSALHLAMKLAGVKRGDYVFCSDLTFAASCNPIVYEGGIPVFIDSEPGSYNMSPVALEKAFKEYTPKAVVVVSLYGTPASMDPIMEICKKHNVVVIEDAAESLGATYKDRLIGTFGKYNVISFNGNKIITTSGGGMLLLDNKEDRDLAFKWATQSREKERFYEHKEIGYNYRMSNICAAIGCGQFEHLQEFINIKRNIFTKYLNDLKDVDGIEVISEPEDRFSTHWLTIAKLTNNMDPLKLIEYLDQNNIETRHIWKPMHMQPIFKENPFFSHYDNTSVSEELFKTGICLPSDSNMTEEEQNKVIYTIKDLLSK